MHPRAGTFCRYFIYILMTTDITILSHACRHVHNINLTTTNAISLCMYLTNDIAHNTVIRQPKLFPQCHKTPSTKNKIHFTERNSKSRRRNFKSKENIRYTNKKRNKNTEATDACRFFTRFS